VPKVIKLDPDTLNPPHPEHIRGVDVEVEVPPHDVPAAVRGNYDESTKTFTIRFEYIGGDEPVTPIGPNEPIRLLVGQKTNRLYGIEIQVDALGIDQVNLRFLGPRVNQAIDQLANSPQLRFRRGNYRIAKNIVTGFGERLLNDALAR